MVRIDSLASSGEGVGHLEDGRVVFVQGACPGDTVEIEVVAEKKRWVGARVASVVEPSADRVDAPCPYFGACGGCQWQHVAYPAQLSAKKRIVADALERIGGFSAEGLVRDCIGSPKTYGYRNKIELVPTPGDRLELGFHRLKSDEVLPIAQCLLLPGAHTKAPARLAGALRYVSGTNDLGILRVGLRIAENTRDVEVALWTPPGAFPRTTVATTLTEAVKASSVVRVLTKDARERHAAPSVEVLAGKGLWREKFGGHTFSVSAPSFFQVNTKMAEVLVAAAAGAIAADGSDAVLDLFAGVGTFTLRLAQDAGTVAAVEGAGSAVRDLKRNLENAGSFAEVAPGHASRVLPILGRFDAVLVDPPRAGLEEGLASAVARTSAHRIVYVSCDPATLARDAKTLLEEGYQLVSALPLDLFPQTPHVETVATFETA